MKTVKAFLLSILIFGVYPLAAQNLYQEDFTTTQYRDAVNTTAWWNTSPGELNLNPYMLTLVGHYEIDEYHQPAIAVAIEAIVFHMIDDLLIIFGP